MKSRILAAILAFFLGGIGAHQFYLGNTKKGILYVIFVWTYIPSIIALIDGIRYLCCSDDEFQRKYCNTVLSDRISSQTYEQCGQITSFCISCGSKIEHGAKFCPNCGTKIE